MTQNPQVKYQGTKPKKFRILNRPTPDQTIENLKQQLECFFYAENYELAAYLRDKIKEMKNEGQ